MVLRYEHAAPEPAGQQPLIYSGAEKTLASSPGHAETGNSSTFRSHATQTEAQMLENNSVNALPSTTQKSTESPARSQSASPPVPAVANAPSEVPASTSHTVLAEPSTTPSLQPSSRRAWYDAQPDLRTELIQSLEQVCIEVALVKDELMPNKHVGNNMEISLRLEDYKEVLRATMEFIRSDKVKKVLPDTFGGFEVYAGKTYQIGYCVCTEFYTDLMKEIVEEQFDLMPSKVSKWEDIHERPIELRLYEQLRQRIASRKSSTRGQAMDSRARLLRSLKSLLVTSIEEAGKLAMEGGLHHKTGLHQLQLYHKLNKELIDHIDLVMSEKVFKVVEVSRNYYVYYLDGILRTFTGVDIDEYSNYIKTIMEK